MQSGPSPLEVYLQQESEAGVVEDSERVFTVTREMAMKKLAAFQLPDPSYWILKVVQMAVAAGAKSIDISLLAKSTEVRVNGAFQWDLDELDQALFDPEYSSSPDLSHLTVGLRAIGFGENRPFLVRVGDSSDCLSFNQGKLSRSEWEFQVDAPFYLAVSTMGADEIFDRFNLAGKKGPVPARNAEMALVLESKAHTCPIPLSVDGRRVDSIELNPDFGWSPTSETLAVGFGKGNLPKIKMSSSLMQANHDEKSPAWGLIQSFSRRHALIYAVNLNKEKYLLNDQWAWTLTDRPSSILWVDDGVVISSTELPTPASKVGVGVFVNATGLPKDLTGFGLLQSSEQRERKREVFSIMRSLAPEIAQIKYESIQNAIESSSNLKSKTSIVLSLLGIGTLFFSVPMGVLFLVGAVAGGAGKARDLCSRSYLGPEAIKELARSLSTLA